MEINQDIIDKIFEKHGETIEAERLCTFYRLLVKNGFYKTKRDYPSISNFNLLVDSLIELGFKLYKTETENDSFLTKTLNFDWLKYFLAFAEHNNTAKAAYQLSVTQQAIVKGISNIENFYKIKLINRNKHFTELTPEGKIFKEKAEKILNTFTEIENIFEVEVPENESFTILYQDDWQFYFISKIIDYLNNQTKFKINLVKIINPEETYNFSVNPDLIIAAQDISYTSKEYESFSFKKSRSVIVGNKKLMREKGNFKFITEINKLLSETKSSKSKNYKEAVEKLYVPEKYLKKTIYSNYFDAHIKLCENGYGYAFLPTIAIAEQLKNKTLEIMEEVPESYNLFFYFIIKKDIDKNIKRNILKVFEDFNNEIY